MTLSNEEYSVLRLISNKTVDKSELTPRQQVIANQLVSKDVLHRAVDGTTTTYSAKKNQRG